LRAEHGHYDFRGSSSRGILGAKYTGRSIDVEGRYPTAKAWLENYETSPRENAELEHELLHSLVLAAPSTLNTPVFRGRLLSSPPGSFEVFGPPPRDQAPRGRYNAPGVPVLYLCSSERGVISELGPSQPRTKLWIQRFRIVPELRMADARGLVIDSLAAAVFWLIESGRDRTMLPPRLGERVGQIIGASYDGLIVPGVRGEPNELYWNAVVFRPEDWWLQLVDRSVQPQEAS
jgi:hypothetical protein